MASAEELTPAQAKAPPAAPAADPPGLVNDPPAKPYRAPVSAPKKSALPVLPQS